MRRAFAAPPAVALALVFASGALAHAKRLRPQSQRHVASDDKPDARSAPEAHGGASSQPRRDPFVRPAVALSRAPAERDAGNSGVAVGSVTEIVVRGVWQAHGEHVALVQTPDGRHYRVRAGDRMLDGRVQSVSADGLVILPDASGAPGVSPVHRRLRPEWSSQ
jgi:hypothetical protein